MASPKYTILPCTPADITSMVTIYETAFSSAPIYTYMWPSTHVTPTSKSTWLSARFLSQMAHIPEMKFFKLVDEETGKIVAWSRWQFPAVLSADEKKRREEREKKEQEKEDGSGTWPEGAIVENCERFFGAIKAAQDKFLNSEEMYLLHLLATRPDYQKRGLGKILLQHVLDLADQEGRKAYLEGLPPGRQLYLKTGFRDLELLTFDMKALGVEEPAVVNIMVRDPQPLVIL